MESYDNNQYNEAPTPIVTPSAPQPERNSLALASMIIGIIAIPFSCCSIVGIILPIIGIVLVILSKKGKPLTGYAIAGLTLSIISLIAAIALFIYFLFVIKMMQDPQYGPMFNEMTNIMNQYMQPTP